MTRFIVDNMLIVPGCFLIGVGIHSVWIGIGIFFVAWGIHSWPDRT